MQKITKSLLAKLLARRHRLHQKKALEDYQPQGAALDERRDVEDLEANIEAKGREQTAAGFRADLTPVERFAKRARLQRMLARMKARRNDLKAK